MVNVNENEINLMIKKTEWNLQPTSNCAGKWEDMKKLWRKMQTDGMLWFFCNDNFSFHVCIVMNMEMGVEVLLDEYTELWCSLRLFAINQYNEGALSVWIAYCSTVGWFNNEVHTGEWELSWWKQFIWWKLFVCLLVVFFFFDGFAESMKVKKTDLPVMPSEDILPSLDDEADDSSMDDGKLQMLKPINTVESEIN